MNTEKSHLNPYFRRIDSVTARNFAYKVHTSDSPVLFRIHENRAEANSRCWEWNKKRPVFQGLGVEFFVRTLKESGKDMYGIFGKKSKNAHQIVLHTDQGTFLKLNPNNDNEEDNDVTRHN